MKTVFLTMVLMAVSFSVFASNPTDTISNEEGFSKIATGPALERAVEETKDKIQSVDDLKSKICKIAEEKTDLKCDSSKESKNDKSDSGSSNSGSKSTSTTEKKSEPKSEKKEECNAAECQQARMFDPKN